MKQKQSNKIKFIVTVLILVHQTTWDYKLDTLMSHHICAQKHCQPSAQELYSILLFILQNEPS